MSCLKPSSSTSRPCSAAISMSAVRTWSATARRRTSSGWLGAAAGPERMP
ncbi:hypothetical protein ACIBK9_13650 [Nonomuraea sp. NPDC050227]